MATYNPTEDFLYRAKKLTPAQQQEIVLELSGLAIDEQKKARELSKIIPIMEGVSFDEVEEQFRKGDTVEGISTGYWTLDRMTAGLVPGELTVITAESGIGKCFRKGTRVLMADGTTKAIEKIRDGELVQGVSGVRKVIGHHQGFGKSYKITPRKGTPFYVSDKHIMSCSLNGKIVNLFIEDLLDKRLERNGDIARYKLYRVGVDYCRKELPIPPYILGVWLGDGNKDSSAITTKDKAIEKVWCDYGEKYGCLVRKTVKWDSKLQRNSLASTIWLHVEKGHKNPIRDKLKQIGVFNNKHIPLDYLTGDREQRLELLAGLLDTDGYYGNGCYEIIQKRESLAEQIAQLARGLGFAAYIKEKVVNNKVYWRISISGELSVLPCLIKKAFPRKQAKNVLLTGFRIEQVENCPYYGIAVDGDSLFLLADNTVVHNTLLCVNMAARQLCLGYKVLMISLENTVKSIRRRLRGVMGPEYFPLIVKEENMFIQQSPQLPPSSIKYAVESAKEKGVQVVYIDHLQYLQSGIENPVEEIGRITKECKILSQEFAIPIILVSQVRKIEKGNQISADDLYGSVKIRQTADIILIADKDPQDLRQHVRVTVHKQRDRVLWRLFSSTKLTQIGFDLEEPAYSEEIDMANDVMGKPRAKGSTPLSFRG